MSHFTAQKYMTAAREYPRDVAIRHGVEKVYALSVYAKAIGRKGEGPTLLRRDERIAHDEEGKTAQRISGSRLRSIIRRLKHAEQDAKVPADVKRDGEQAAIDAEKNLRSLGWPANAKVVRRGREMRIVIECTVAAVRALDSKLPARAIRLIAKLAAQRPDVAALVRSSPLARRLKNGAR
jgi:hypothetical protein